MNKLADFDYFSRNYKQFEDEFHKYSKLGVPLTFLTDDILLTMHSTGHNYFYLPAQDASDRKKRRFDFEIVDDIYVFVSSTTDIF
ncbi:hypothetical protein BI362_00980 [Streptococcus parauberis]|nr:hypothetical protein BI362_00980 [Streptococcus parauberis]QBX27703.1 hypothetical protein Javan406_0053 [Streptococcus phage Javan406]